MTKGTQEEPLDTAAIRLTLDAKFIGHETKYYSYRK